MRSSAPSNPTEVALFARFAAVGAAGFLVDAAVLALMLKFGAGLYAGRLISYLVAATATWYVNRRVTFSSRDPRLLTEWTRFLLANAGGGIINYLVYAGLVSSAPLFGQHPTFGVAAGSIAGLLLNFSLSRYVVFRRNR